MHKMPVSIFAEPSVADSLVNDLESDQTLNINNAYDLLKRITKVGFVDQYDSLSKIGQGTFGEVFKARNKTSKLFVAMKRIKTELEREGVCLCPFLLKLVPNYSHSRNPAFAILET